MKNNDFAMLIVAILFIALASSGMNMITGSSSVTAEAGSVVEIPWSFVYNDGWFLGYDTDGRILVKDMTTDNYDILVWAGAVSDGKTYSSTFNYQVPDTVGEYKINIVSDIWNPRVNDYVNSGGFYITFNVVLSLPEVDDDGVVNDGGVVPDDIPTDQTVEAAILGDSLTDKILMLLDLIKALFENLFGGTK